MSTKNDFRSFCMSRKLSSPLAHNSDSRIIKKFYSEWSRTPHLLDDSYILDAKKFIKDYSIFVLFSKKYNLSRHNIYTKNIETLVSDVVSLFNETISNISQQRKRDLSGKKIKLEELSTLGFSFGSTSSSYNGTEETFSNIPYFIFSFYNNTQHYRTKKKYSLVQIVDHAFFMARLSDMWEDCKFFGMSFDSSVFSSAFSFPTDFSKKRSIDRVVYGVTHQNKITKSMVDASIFSKTPPIIVPRIADFNGDFYIKKIDNELTSSYFDKALVFIEQATASTPRSVLKAQSSKLFGATIEDVFSVWAFTFGFAYLIDKNGASPSCKKNDLSIWISSALNLSPAQANAIIDLLTFDSLSAFPHPVDTAATIFVSVDNKLYYLYQSSSSPNPHYIRQTILKKLDMKEGGGKTAPKIDFFHRGLDFENQMVQRFSYLSTEKIIPKTIENCGSFIFKTIENKKREIDFVFVVGRVIYICELKYFDTPYPQRDIVALMDKFTSKKGNEDSVVDKIKSKTSDINRLISSNQFLRIPFLSKKTGFKIKKHKLHKYTLTPLIITNNTHYSGHFVDGVLVVEESFLLETLTGIENISFYDQKRHVKGLGFNCFRTFASLPKDSIYKKPSEIFLNFHKNLHNAEYLDRFDKLVPVNKRKTPFSRLCFKKFFLDVFDPVSVRDINF